MEDGRPGLQGKAATLAEKRDASLCKTLVGAVLARDEGTLVYQANRGVLIAGKHRSHRDDSTQALNPYPCRALARIFPHILAISSYSAWGFCCFSCQAIRPCSWGRIMNSPWAT